MHHPETIVFDLSVLCDQAEAAHDGQGCLRRGIRPSAPAARDGLSEEADGQSDELPTGAHGQPSRSSHQYAQGPDRQGSFASDVGELLSDCCVSMGLMMKTAICKVISSLHRFTSLSRLSLLR